MSDEGTPGYRWHRHGTGSLHGSRDHPFLSTIAENQSRFSGNCQQLDAAHAERPKPLILLREEESLLCQLNKAGNQARNFNAALNAYWFSGGESCC